MDEKSVSTRMLYGGTRAWLYWKNKELDTWGLCVIRISIYPEFWEVEVVCIRNLVQNLEYLHFSHNFSALLLFLGFFLSLCLLPLVLL